MLSKSSHHLKLMRAKEGFDFMNENKFKEAIALNSTYFRLLFITIKKI